MPGQKSTRNTYENGDEYYGQVNDKRQRHGFGCYVYADGNYYEGEWLNDKPNGFGGKFYSSGN